MKKIIEFFAEQHLFGNLVTLSIVGLGIYSALNIRREVFPNVSFDIVGVTTLFPGASSAEVEKLITNPLEQDLKEVDGIKKLTSHTVEGRSLILLQIDPDVTTEDKAKSDVRDVVDSVIPELPEGSERPLVSTFDTKRTPLVEVAVTSSEIPEMELRQIAKKLEREFEKIKGVAAVNPMGLRDLEMLVEVEPDKLAKYHLSLPDLVEALKRQNVSIPGGSIEGVEKNAFLEQSVRTSGQFQTPKDVENTVIRANELAQPVRIGDVAKVTYGLKKAAILTRVDGKPCIRLTLMKEQKADAIDMVDAVNGRIQELKPELDPRLELKLVNDTSEYIRRRLGILLGNFWLGFALVLIILPLFLPYRFALVVAAGEPFAFLGALLIFHLGGGALNMISVIGLILVSGILVDDGIVVSENVARLIKSGMSPKKAAIEGAKQVWLPILASSSVTMMAFIPLALMTGIFGKFIMYIPLGIIIPICMSLFENFFIMPHHIGSWLRPKDFEMKRGQGNVFARIRASTDAYWDEKLMPAYGRILDLFMRRRYRVMFGCLAVVAVSLLYATTVMKFVLFPPEGVEIFIVRIETPKGTSLEGTSRTLAPIEAEIARLPKEELNNQIALVGLHQQDSHDPNTQRGTEYGQIIVYLTPENERTRVATEIIEDVRKKIGQPEGVVKLKFERVNPGPPVGKPVSIGIRGDEYPTILPAARDIEALLKEIKGVSDIENNYAIGKKQLNVEVNSKEAAAAGLSVASIGTSVRAVYEGIVATTIRQLDEEVEVRTLLAPEYRVDEEALRTLKIPNPAGYLVPLSSVAKFSRSHDILHYQHEDNQREVRVTAQVDTAVISAMQANNLIRKKIPELRKSHPALTFHFGGEDEDTIESMQSLGKAFLFAVIGIFIILVATFKTLLQPLVLLMSIPLGIVGVIVTFALHGMPLSFLCMVGMIGLSGIIVNNAIVYVDFVNQARREGKDRWSSLKDAAVQRARPIFLTTVTTIIGILPTAYGIGGLDKFVVPIAMSMGWGLLVGSILALFLLPAALAVLDDVSALILRIRGFKKSAEPNDR